MWNQAHYRPRNPLSVATEPPAGTFVYALAQPGANVLIAALEPESISSFVALGMVPSDRRGVANPQEAAPSELPIYRLLRPVPMDTQPQPK